MYPNMYATCAQISLQRRSLLLLNHGCEEICPDKVLTPKKRKFHKTYFICELFVFNYIVKHQLDKHVLTRLIEVFILFVRADKD